ncbi:hypothetical protein SADUNF_Sadunf06G0143500 [Salix dunnii]|uniref:Uncharacterized protein n=1 Tax=Salix dunnii TaxID=1413687 RepID=A0A835K1V5_9ROSI|nr:hypothetical protein SADUNF_Sadunf06G0143500 [Salix dunnii]
MKEKIEGEREDLVAGVGVSWNEVANGGDNRNATDGHFHWTLRKFATLVLESQRGKDTWAVEKKDRRRKQRLNGHVEKLKNSLLTRGVQSISV